MNEVTDYVHVTCAAYLTWNSEGLCAQPWCVKIKPWHLDVKESHIQLSCNKSICLTEGCICILLWRPLLSLMAYFKLHDHNLGTKRQLSIWNRPTAWNFALHNLLTLVPFQTRIQKEIFSIQGQYPLSLHGKEQLGHSVKRLLLCSTSEVGLEYFFMKMNLL